MIVNRETDLDNVIQINNVFTNVSKGEVAPKDNLQKCFKTEDLDQIIKEVIIINIFFLLILYINTYFYKIFLNRF